MSGTIYVQRRPSDPTIIRIDGEVKDLERLLPTLELREAEQGIAATFNPERVVCNCVFDGPAVGLNTIHCFTCDGRGFYINVFGFTSSQDHFWKYFAPAIKAAGMTIVSGAFEGSKIAWTP